MDHQVNLSMAERLSANMKISAMYKRAYPDLEGGSLKKRAAGLELDIYQSCKSGADYQARCEALLEELSNQAKLLGQTHGQEETETSGTNQPVERIGPYAATYHASGLFSTIYRSISDEYPGEVIAIKLTTPSTMVAPHNSKREARILRLAVHDTVIPIYSGRSIAGGQYIITLPFMPHDLDTLLHQGTLSTTQIKSHLYALFDALSFCHSRGVLHRDVKPSNILLKSPSGPAYLADFGIAWSATDRDAAEVETADNKITDIGTTCYRAPELLFGNTEYGEGVDLWAAGCVIAEGECRAKTLFDSGDVGSELALIKSIFSTLGTPNDDTWPEAKTFPDWGKMAFKEYPAKEWQEIIPEASNNGQDLVSRLIKYESGQRLSASEVLKHAYFAGIKIRPESNDNGQA